MNKHGKSLFQRLINTRRKAEERKVGALDLGGRNVKQDHQALRASHLIRPRATWSLCQDAAGRGRRAQRRGGSSVLRPSRDVRGSRARQEAAWPFPAPRSNGAGSQPGGRAGTSHALTGLEGDTLNTALGTASGQVMPKQRTADGPVTPATEADQGAAITRLMDVRQGAAGNFQKSCVYSEGRTHRIC